MPQRYRIVGQPAAPPTDQQDAAALADHRDSLYVENGAREPKMLYFHQRIAMPGRGGTPPARVNGGNPMTEPQSTPTQDLPQEVWRAITGYDGVYEVSNLGRIRRVPAWRQYPGLHILRQNPTGAMRNYWFVTLYRRDGGRQRYVHRLVAEAFIGPIPDGYEVNHQRGTDAGNAVTNLEIVTPLRNKQHARDSGLTDASGEKNPAAKLIEDDVRAIRASRETLAVLANRYGVSYQLISQVRLRRVWRHVA